MKFDIKCFSLKAINGQALAELLVNHLTLPMDKKTDLSINVTNIDPNHWELYFHGASVSFRGGASPHGGTSVVLMQPS